MQTQTYPSRSEFLGLPPGTELQQSFSGSKTFGLGLSSATSSPGPCHHNKAKSQPSSSVLTCHWRLRQVPSPSFQLPPCIALKRQMGKEAKNSTAEGFRPWGSQAIHLAFSLAWSEHRWHRAQTPCLSPLPRPESSIAFLVTGRWKSPEALQAWAAGLSSAL